MVYIQDMDPVFMDLCLQIFLAPRSRNLGVQDIYIYTHTCTYLYMYSQGCVSLYGSWNLCPQHKMLVTRVPMWHVCSLSRYECLPEYGAPEKLPTSVFYFKLMLFVSHMDVCMDVLPYSCVTKPLGFNYPWMLILSKHHDLSLDILLHWD